MHFARPKPTSIATSLALATVLLAGARPAAAEQDAERVFVEARGYTVRVRTQIKTPFIDDQQGSFEGAGFLVDAARGWIVTNAHVVGRSPSEVQVAFAGESFQAARKVYVDSYADIAVIEIGNVAGKHRAAELNCEGEVHVGEPVGAFGHPLGMYFTGTRGIISGKTDQFGPDLLQIDATVDHGNSGGPTIALRDGRVVGIATAMAGADKADRVNFATPMKDVGRILALLRRGIMPSPPLMRFAFLRDETGSHTLMVANSFDPGRWPLEPGDRVIGIEGRPGELRTLSDFVGALRGCSGRVPLRVERGGRTVTIPVSPQPAPLLTDAHGISLDGALIASIPVEDQSSLSEGPHLFVHSLEPGSTAETLDIQKLDILYTVDGRHFGDLDSLGSYLRERPEGQDLKIVFRRVSGFNDRWFDYIVRDMPGTDIHAVGAEPDPVAAHPGD